MVLGYTMNARPLVSVCVVTYNQERYIRDCLMSIVAQSADVSIEVLVGDDCSTDRTSEIVADVALAYPELFRVVRSMERLGSGSKNLLRLLPEARGQYIAHLDGDDYWLPGKLREQVLFFDRHPDIEAVYSNALVVDDANNMRGAFNASVPEQFDLGFLLRRGNFLCHGSLLYRTRCRERLLKLSPPVLDYRFHVELARQGSLGYVNACLVGYRVASATSVCVGNSPLVRRLYLDALAAIEANSRWRDDSRRAYGHFLAMAVWDLVALNFPDQMTAIIRRAWQEAPSPRWRLLGGTLLALLDRVRFKAANFLAAKVLRRPLKIYFPR